MPNLADSQPGSPRDENPFHWSRSSSEADEDEVPDEFVTPQWNYDKKVAKERNMQLMEEGPTMDIAKMVGEGITFPVVSLESPPSRASR